MVEVLVDDLATDVLAIMVCSILWTVWCSLSSIAELNEAASEGRAPDKRRAASDTGSSIRASRTTYIVCGLRDIRKSWDGHFDEYGF